jgi:hypothetical protein
VRLIIRLVVLALSAYGAWKLYEEYGDRLPAMRGSLDEFSERSGNAANDAAQRVGFDLDDAGDALRDAASDIGNAAKDAQDNVTRSLRDTSNASTRSSY